MIRSAIVAAACLALAACQTSPAKMTYAAKTGLTTAEGLILTYDQLPRCSATVPQPCSTQSVVTTLQAGKNTARSTINQAEVVVRDPATPKSGVLQWASAAAAAVKALLASIPQPGAK